MILIVDLHSYTRNIAKEPVFIVVFLNQCHFDAISIFASILSEATIYIFPVAFLNQSYFDAISIFASILSEATIYNN